MNSPSGQLEVPYSPLNWLSRTAILSSGLLSQLIKLAFAPRKRDSTQVAGEYDQNAWKVILEGESWLKSDALEKYLVPDDNSSTVAQIEGRLVRVRVSDYYRFRLRKLQQILVAFGAGSPEIVE